MTINFTEDGPMAETNEQKEAREALERAKLEAEKALEKIKAGKITDEKDLGRLKERAGAFFDVNIGC
jgi:hypothetical protein